MLQENWRSSRRGGDRGLGRGGHRAGRQLDGGLLLPL